jgi:hypothetical protein
VRNTLLVPVVIIAVGGCTGGEEDPQWTENGLDEVQQIIAENGNR